MMKTADARQGPRLAWFGRAWLNRPARRRRLLQADVRAVFLVIGDIFAPQSPEVLIVEWDYVIKHFTAKPADAPAVKNLKRIEKAWFPVSQFSRTAGF